VWMRVLSGRGGGQIMTYGIGGSGLLVAVGRSKEIGRVWARRSNLLLEDKDPRQSRGEKRTLVYSPPLLRTTVLGSPAKRRIRTGKERIEPDACKLFRDAYAQTATFTPRRTLAD